MAEQVGNAILFNSDTPIKRLSCTLEYDTALGEKEVLNRTLLPAASRYELPLIIKPTLPARSSASNPTEHPIACYGFVELVDGSLQFFGTQLHVLVFPVFVPQISRGFVITTLGQAVPATSSVGFVASVYGKGETLKVVASDGTEEKPFGQPFHGFGVAAAWVGEDRRGVPWQFSTSIKAWLDGEQLIVNHTHPHELYISLPSCGTQCGPEGYRSLKLTLALHIETQGTIWSLDRSTSCPPSCPGGGKGIFVSSSCPIPEPLTLATCLDPLTASKCFTNRNGKCISCPNGAVCPGQSASPSQTSSAIQVFALRLLCFCSCPGGSRVWPLPGYWTNDENGGTIQACSAPAAERCKGWNATEARVQCGEGFADSSYLCSTCDAGYFELDGNCSPCPRDTEMRYTIIVLPLVFFVVSTFLVFGGVLLTVVIVIGKYTTGKRKWGRAVKISLDFSLWYLLLLQLLAQVARVSAPGLPGWLRNIFTALKFVQLDFGSLSPPACQSNFPFLLQLLIGLISLLLMASWLVMKCTYARCRRPPIAAWGGFAAMTAAAVLYSVSVNYGLSMFHCLYDSGAGVYLWLPNPYIQCYEGSHLFMAVGAGVLLVVHGAGLPALMLVEARSVIRRTQVEGGSTAVVAKSSASFRGIAKFNTSNPCCKGCPGWCHVSRGLHEHLRTLRFWSAIFATGQAWFRSASLLFIFWLGAVEAMFSAQSTTAARIAQRVLAVTSTFVFALVVFKLRPDHEWVAWRRWPRLYSGLIAVLIVGLQLILELEDINNSEDLASTPLLSDPGDPGDSGASSTPTLSTVVRGYILFTLVFALFLPLLLITSFGIWLQVMLGGRCCRCAYRRAAIGVSKVAVLAEMGVISAEEKQQILGGTLPRGITLTPEDMPPQVAASSRKLREPGSVSPQPLNAQPAGSVTISGVMNDSTRQLLRNNSGKSRRWSRNPLAALSSSKRQLLQRKKSQKEHSNPMTTPNLKPTAEVNSTSECVVSMPSADTDGSDPLAVDEGGAEPVGNVQGGGSRRWSMNPLSSLTSSNRQLLITRWRSKSVVPAISTSDMDATPRRVSYNPLQLLSHSKRSLIATRFKKPLPHLGIAVTDVELTPLPVQGRPNGLTSPGDFPTADRAPPLTNTTSPPRRRGHLSEASLSHDELAKFRELEEGLKTGRIIVKGRTIKQSNCDSWEDLSLDFPAVAKELLLKRLGVLQHSQFVSRYVTGVMHSRRAARERTRKVTVQRAPKEVKRMDL